MSPIEKTKIYVDSNVYIDFLNSRAGRLGPDAYTIFVEVQQGKYQLIISPWVLREIYPHVKNIDDVKLLLSLLKENMTEVTYTQDEENQAKTLAASKSETHWHDALHAILAKKGGAKYLITNNIKDFLPYTDLVTPKHPRDFGV